MADQPVVPPAVVVTAGKVPGDVPPGGGTPAPGGGGRRSRKLSNYLIDKRLQLRYIIVVTLVSALIAGTLGFLIYQQEHDASAKLEQGLSELAGNDASLAEYGHEFAADIAKRDQTLVFQMVGIGLGLTVILSGFLLIMTHKVAGPLYKVGIYMERMADGRLGTITALRRGDMLQDFYTQFRESHDAVRDRLRSDADVMATFADAWAAADKSDAVTTLRDHVAARRSALS